HRLRKIEYSQPTCTSVLQNKRPKAFNFNPFKASVGGGTSGTPSGPGKSGSLPEKSPPLSRSNGSSTRWKRIGISTSDSTDTTAKPGALPELPDDSVFQHIELLADHHGENSCAVVDETERPAVIKLAGAERAAGKLHIHVVPELLAGVVGVQTCLDAN